jgi:signal transduction histidine kinase
VNLSFGDALARFSVRDHGQGIRENELGNLFKPFQKTSTRSTAGEKSTGLGLMIVKKIVEAHGGEVGVTSRYGEGSEFYFTLPIL